MIINLIDHADFTQGQRIVFRQLSVPTVPQKDDLIQVSAGSIFGEDLRNLPEIQADCDDAGMLYFLVQYRFFHENQDGVKVIVKRINVND